MGILLKYTLKSIGERKFRAFLIIFAIALSGGLFLASIRLSDNIGNMYLEKVKAAYGNIDLMIYPNEHSGTPFINMSVCDKVKDKIEAAIPYVSSTGTYSPDIKEKSWNISISGYNLEDYYKLNKLKIVEGNIDSFKGNQIIISEHSAKELGLSVGDSFELVISGGKRKVNLCALAGSEGIFSGEQNGYKAIMPFDTISKYNHTNGKPSTIYLMVKEGIDIYELQQELKEAYSKYEVEELIDEETLKQELSTITVPFLLMTFIVVFMSAFIIYSCFKVIMLEKLPMVGTFRSVGADKKMMNGVLMLEALFYGVSGGICSCFLGMACLYGLEKLMSGMLFEGAESSISLEVPMNTYIMIFLLGVGIALVSTIIPILSISKISLKDIILNNRTHKKSKRLGSSIVGLILIVLGFAIAMLIKGDMGMLTSLIGFFLIIIGIIKVLPLFVLNVSRLLGLIFKVVFGNVGELATKNIKKNKSVLNSITLITIGMSVLLMISTTTQNMKTVVFDVYGDFHCEIMGQIEGFNDQRLKMLRRTKGVENVIECIENNTKVEEFNDNTVFVEAISTTRLLPEIDFGVKGDEEALLKKLQTGRYMILNQFLKTRYNVENGDQLTFKFEGKPRTYTVIGFMNTQWCNGQMALVPLKYFKQDSGIQEYNWFYMSLKPGIDPRKVISDIEDHLNGDYSYMDTIQSFAQRNADQNDQLMGMLSIFAILAMLIGIIGVLNNLMISFIERRQNIAMLRSIGMSKLQVLKMIFIEGLGSGLIGAFGGIGGGILCCKIFEYIIYAMNLELEMKILPNLFVSYVIGGIIITVVGSIIPARGSSKLNIIEAIKYE